MAWGPFNAGGGGGSSGGTAADISYDNSKSGISASNVQEAIDALSVLTLTIQAVPTQSGSLTYGGRFGKRYAGADRYWKLGHGNPNRHRGC